MAAFSPCQVGSHSLRRSQKFLYWWSSLFQGRLRSLWKESGKNPTPTATFNINWNCNKRNSLYIIMVSLMVFNATFNNISVLHWFVASDYPFGIFKLMLWSLHTEKFVWLCLRCLTSLDDSHFRNPSRALKLISTFLLLFYNIKMVFSCFYVLFFTKVI